MLVLLCDHPRCHAEATDTVTHPGMRWVLCVDHADAERALAASLRATTPCTHASCLVAECGRPRMARGLCSAHYQRARRRGLLPSIRPRQAAAALKALPSTPPTIAHLSRQPSWVRHLVETHHADAWARIRQTLHRVAELPL